MQLNSDPEFTSVGSNPVSYVEGKKFVLLLAEDNPGDVFLVRRALDSQQVNYSLSVAKDGEEAIAYLSTAAQNGQQLDLVLVDLNLPKYDGAEVITHLKTHHALQSVPVVVLTSSDSPRDRDRCLSLGASQYFQKPSDLDLYMKLGKIVKTLVES